jgi:hypothetical protein
MGPGGLRVVVVPAQEPGIAGQGRQRLVSWKPDPEVSQLHAGLARVTGEQLQVPVHLSVNIPNNDQSGLSRLPLVYVIKDIITYKRAAGRQPSAT